VGKADKLTITIKELMIMLPLHGQNTAALQLYVYEMSVSCVVMKSGNLNLLEPSEPLQAGNGTALPFTRRG